MPETPGPQGLLEQPVAQRAERKSANDHALAQPPGEDVLMPPSGLPFPSILFLRSSANLTRRDKVEA